jgi:hypothetical protein
MLEGWLNASSVGLKVLGEALTFGKVPMRILSRECNILAWGLADVDE